MAAFSRHEDMHGDLKPLSRRLWTIWEHVAVKPAIGWRRDSSKGVTTIVDTDEKTKSRTIYSGRSIQSICKETMSRCYDVFSIMSIMAKGIQRQTRVKKNRQMMKVMKEYYLRNESDRHLSTLKNLKKCVDIAEQIRADLKILMNQYDLQPENQTDKRLINESTKQSTNNSKPPTKPAYTFIVRNSLFPDPKYCFFSTSVTATSFGLPKIKTVESAEKISARFALSTAMAIKATVPPKEAPLRCNSELTASRPGRPPKYDKISSTGLYIKYNPGTELFSLLTAARHSTTKKYTTVGNSTTIHYDKTKEQCLTGYSTVIKGKKDRQKVNFRNETVSYSTNLFLTGTLHSTAQLLGETDRQEYYYKFRQPPPYRDKPQPPGTEFNGTVRTKGASLRREHYQAFRRPPPLRDKYSEPQQ